MIDHAKRAYRKWPWRDQSLSEAEVFEAAFWLGCEHGIVQTRKEGMDDETKEAMALIREAAKIIKGGA